MRPLRRGTGSASLGIATRGTSREINRRIVLDLVRARQPLSRADLARVMGVRRGAVSLIVNDLLERGLIFEGATGEAMRGRKPTYLFIDSRRRAVVAADIRASQTYLMLADLTGKPHGEVVALPTLREPAALVSALARHIEALVAAHPEVDTCEGVGVVVPGMVEHTTMRILHAPTLGWRDVQLREPLAAATGLPVHIENSGRACALAQIWSARHTLTAAEDDLVFLSVSDGLGVGVVIHGEILRGRHNIAGEFGHLPIAIDGPPCSCGARGCWETYVSNRATLARYFDRPALEARPRRAKGPALTVDELVTRARAGESKAVVAIEETARYLGLGLGAVVNALDPTCVYIGGEITLAWDLIEPIVRAGLAERALTPEAAAIDIRIVPASAYPRLQGAAALVAGPALSAPVFA